MVALGGVVVALPLGSNPVAFFGVIVVGVVIAAVVYNRGGHCAELQDDKVAASLGILRRLDFLAGSPVSIALGLTTDPGRLAAESHESQMWSEGTATTRFVREDAWLHLEGVLSNQIGIRLGQMWCPVILAGSDPEILAGSVPPAAFPGLLLLSRGVHEFLHSVELRYDPSRNPSVARAGTDIATRIALPPGARSVGGDNQPGALSLVVNGGPREQGDIRIEELTAVAAQLVSLVDPSRAVILPDRDAWASMPSVVQTAPSPRTSVAGALPWVGLSTALASVGAGVHAYLERGNSDDPVGIFGERFDERWLLVSAVLLLGAVITLTLGVVRRNTR
ncbi:MAG: hypothetical protein JNL79_33170 [Myxococcales bacterium]|nr:hypothetical protein [Myxococcales bacterium]